MALDLDSLCLLVTEAILRADALEDLGSGSARGAHREVSLLEEQIAAALPATETEGALARRGAVRSAVLAGDQARAESLAALYGRDFDPESGFAHELQDMVRMSGQFSPGRSLAFSSRFPWAHKRYGMDDISRLAGVLFSQAEPLPIG
jgi:hypothetical protein